MADVSQLRVWLASAELARHNLATGSLRQRVNYQGQEVAFVTTDMDKLNAYISWLRGQIAGCEGNARGASKPIYFTF
jgi:hypothetical protein